ncbi:hypothetical protein BLS_001572 [Venturia inaequalis]|uniref:HAD-like protein n=1 Tax=Venturia inaequalis TaxID=5025 RepID=A0A8H3Z775_VENIN|nr:hypothetical protein BLS_001572 [Venturia inaequalis]KAE9982106.1 hypothetical protein EG328_011210 [Venturia inaequalis]KAE9986345.1 hypothetical protein EG327_004392 [Venturia inaequalis]RDI89131.1 hypothetical protein Vi05172_g274 [Venturia inaequalis]
MSRAPAQEPRRFAALDPDRKSGSQGPKLDGIVFDVDGTLCEPQNYMFAEMRSALGIQKPTDILDHIYSLPQDEQEPAMQKIRDIESTAMINQTPQPGLLQLMDYLQKRGIRKGICTRNFDTPVNHLIEKFMKGHDFAPIITRDFRPPKPSPAGILHIASSWSLPSAKNLIMVGDSIDDMTAGYRAGAATVLLVNEVNAELAEHEHTDLCIKKLDELIDILEGGFTGQVGREAEGEGMKTGEMARGVLGRE